MTASFEIRAMTDADWNEVAALIHDSTNAWYESQGRDKIFGNGRESTKLFCEVYEALDPGCCLLAVQSSTGEIAGSCFYHPRPTHLSLGIMNVQPDYFGQGIARALLQNIESIADQRGLPIRLVSSAINLDSYSLYNRAGFVPLASFQDMLISVPESGVVSSVDTSSVRRATIEDVPAMVALESELVGLERSKDFHYFIENALGIWETRVLDGSQGLDGFITSVRHTASNMIGPGVMRSESTAIALIESILEHHRGNSAVIVTPTSAKQLVNSLYAHEARNCELHFAQVRGAAPPLKGVVIPTFMPETG